MKISVAMASYNGANFILEQLDSIINQTRKVDEIIICDDGSSDNTFDIVTDYIKDNQLENLITLVKNEKNLGYASNFFKAISMTTGDYIFFSDQDDIWVKDKVSNMIEVMEDNEKIDLLCSEFETFISSDDAPRPSHEATKSFTNNKETVKLSFNPSNIFIGCEGCCMLIRKSFFDKVKEYWYPGFAHDEFFWKMALCRDGLYFYHGVTLRRRLHSNNVTMHKMRDLNKRIKFLEDLKKSHEQTLKFVKDTDNDINKVILLKRNIKATALRIEILRDKKLLNTIPLIFKYRDCYHSRKSIPVELMMGIKG
jgi:glycosyltransferase involved in cell wall biosynthesis